MLRQPCTHSWPPAGAGKVPKRRRPIFGEHCSRTRSERHGRRQELRRADRGRGVGQGQRHGVVTAVAETTRRWSRRGVGVSLFRRVLQSYEYLMKMPILIVIAERSEASIFSDGLIVRKCSRMTGFM